MTEVESVIFSQSEFERQNLPAKIAKAVKEDEATPVEDSLDYVQPIDAKSSILPLDGKESL